jgi:DNA-binding transcriptional MocR family regulator
MVNALETLKREGWVQSRQGSGTRVRGRAAPGRPAVGSEDFRSVAVSGIRTAPSTVDLSMAALPAVAMVADEMRLFVREDVESLVTRSGYAPRGLGQLRRAVAAHLERCEVPTTEEDILITTGAQQAFSLLAALFVRPGDSVAVESPTHPAVLDVLRASGAELRAVDIGADGLRLDQLADMLAHRPPRLIHVTPTFNNPTAAVMDEDRRRELARLAARYQVPLVEDNALFELALGDEALPPPVSRFANGGPVILVGSTSKLFWAGLRVGWVRAPRRIIAQLARLKLVSDLGTPLLSQALAARLLPRAPDALAERRRDLAPRLERLTSALGTLLPDWKWRRPRGGFALWVQLPHGDSRELLATAAHHGVVAAAGPLFSVEDGHADCLRLAFTQETHLLEEGVRRLATAWDAYNLGTGTSTAPRIMA